MSHPSSGDVSKESQTEKPSSDMIATLPYYTLAFYILFVIFEIFCKLFGESWTLFFLNMITIPLVLFIFSSHRLLFAVVMVVFSFFEVVDFLKYQANVIDATHTPIAIFRNTDVNFVQPLCVLYCVIALFFYALLLLYPWNLTIRYVKTYVMCGLYLVSGVLFYFYFDLHWNRYFPFFKLMDAQIIPHSPLWNYFTEPPVIKSNGTRKNLIVFQYESFDLEFLGKYSTLCPENMPFLSNMTELGYFNDNEIPQRFVDYTAGAMMAMTCGLPLVRGRQRGPVKGKSPALVLTYHGIGTFLKQAGYNLYMESAAYNSHYQWTIMQHQGFRVQMGEKHHYDRALFDYLAKKRLPQLLKEKDPWVLYIITTNSHLYDNYVDDTCETRFKCTLPYRAFDCTEQLLQPFYELANKSGLFDNTEVMVVGDHKHGGIRGVSNTFKSNRRMGIFIPTRARNNVSKRCSAYDIAPTIMDLMGVEYSPPFPWGTSLFSDEIGTVPYDYDFASLANYWWQHRELDFTLDDMWLPRHIFPAVVEQQQNTI